jgi:hypothetical protein
MPRKFDRKAEEEDDFDSDSSEDVDESLALPVRHDEVCNTHLQWLIPK